MNNDTPDMGFLTRASIDGKPWWRYADGTLFPVVSGGDGEGDDPPADPADPADPAEPNDPPADPPADHKAEAEKWKALARKHEAQAKTNSDAAKKLAELENAGKSETERLQAQLDEARTTARESTVKALKLQVANEKGLPPALAKFLPDLDNEVDMMQAADELLEASGGADKVPQPTRQPKSNLTTPLGGDDASAQRDALVKAMSGI